MPLKEQLPTEIPADLNLQVQESENKKGIWDRTEEAPHKDAKEMNFFSSTCPSPVLEVLIGSKNKTIK